MKHQNVRFNQHLDEHLTSCVKVLPLKMQSMILNLDITLLEPREMQRW